MNNSSNPLVQQILDQANAEAEAIIKGAEEKCGAIIEEAKEKAEHDVQVEKRAFASRLEVLANQEASAKRNVDRLSELKAMDSSYNEVLSKVKERFSSFSSSEDFKSVLVSWIAEAAIGLDKKEAKVAFNSKSPVDEAMLKKAEDLVLSMTGAEVKLSLDSQRCQDIGVIVSSLDGQISFDNELGVRIRRYQKDIRKIVQEENAKQNSR